MDTNPTPVDLETLDADALLPLVHARIGLGLDIRTFAEGTVEIEWVRDYGDEGWSDRRPLSIGKSLRECLLYILRYEDEADAADAAEAAAATSLNH